ncbi:hypothetical protein LCGC14_1045290 [marine sediment metagenome]|uniref:Uncharacterized protein n=1 Tax=marine sediment metagenome TaxID=412755 RepID=A0A0F9NC84_9ZZZZ
MKNGWLVKLMVGAVCAAGVVGLATLVYGVLSGYPGLVTKVKAQETRTEALEGGQAILAINQRVMDEAVRNIEADSGWTQLKLDALLEEAKVTKRIRRPKVKRSELKEVE